MFSQKPEKMTFAIEHPNLLRAVVGDFAARENRSMSAIIERTTLNALLPSNKIMREIAQYQLFCKDGDIGRALSVIFERNSAGVDWKANYDNLLPIVEFARNQSTFCQSLLTTNDDYFLKFAKTHVASQLASIIDYLRDLCAKEEDIVKSACYEREIQFAEQQLNELKTETACYHPMSGFSLVIHNWPDLKGWSITYRFLNDLIQLKGGWRADPEARLELLDLMKIVSAEWEQQQP